MGLRINTYGLLRKSCYTVILVLCLLPECTFSQTYSIADSTKAIQIIRNAFDSIQFNPKRSLARGQEGLEISEKIGFIPGIIRGKVTIGKSYFSMGDMGNALKYYTDALDIARKNKQLKYEGGTLHMISWLYHDIGDLDKSFDYDLQALKISEQMNDSGSMARNYSGLAINLSTRTLNVNNKRLYHDEANNYYLKAIELYDKLKDYTNEATNLGYLAGNYTEQKKFEQAHSCFLRSIALQATPETYNNFGDYFSQTNNNDSALYYYNKALAIFYTDSDKLGIATSLENIGKAQALKGDMTKAEENIKRALTLCEQLGHLQMIGRVTEDLAELYAMKKDYGSAYKYQGEFIKLNDSLLSKETEAKLGELATKFEVNQIEEKNRSLQNLNALQQLKLQRKNILIAAAFSAFAALLVIGLLLFRQSKLKAEQQKSELEQKQLRAQMNPHFIFNCLNSIQHFVVCNDVKNANKYLSGFAQLMRQTLENSKEGIITLRREIAYLDNYLVLERMRFEDKFVYEIVYSDNVNPDAIEIPAMIIQPFIENAIRHGLCYLEGRPGKLKISFYRKDKYLYCEVEDNGIGREQSQKLKIVSDVVYESQGMELTRQRLALVSKSNGSDYKIEIVDKKNASGEADGTTIIIKFPLES